MRIVIIGAGFSGVALATALKAQASDAVAIHLVGIADTHGRGVAYGEARLEHLLNVRARDLGLTPQAPADFADWINLGERGRASFLPRELYGQYLQDRLHEALRDDRGARLHSLHREAVALDRVGGALHVHLDDGATLIADKVVLAVGALPPPPLAGVGPRLAIHPRYIGWPWQEQAIDRIGRDADVLVVGTGLTMADVVATLHRRGHAGRITALSRHGLLPQRHSDQPLPPLSLPPAVLQALAAHDLRGLLARIRALSANSDWRALVDALRPHTQAFWRGLPERERARFLRHLRSYWEVARHRLAPAIADQLDGLRASGQLRIVAGRLLRAGRTDEGVSVLIRERGADALRHERVDVLVRATGLNTDVARTTHPLLAQLRESGLIAADRLDLGLETGEDFELRDVRGEPVRGLYALGPLLRGRLWEITAVPELRVAAQALAQRLLSAEPGGAWRQAAPQAPLRSASH